MASSFSPVPTNLIGLFTTERIERAAPPRVSPSNLVSTTPLKSRRSLNSFAVFTASWPVIESTTKRISFGLIAFLIAAISFIISSSTARRPAVSTITTSYPLAFASWIAFSAIFTGFLLSGSEYIGTPICSANTRNCSIAAGRYTSQATSNGFLFFFVFSIRANLPEKVVLPEPCRPDIKMTAGLPSKSISAVSPPINWVSSSCTIFTINWLGFTAVNTFCPNAFSLTVSVKVLATL